MPTTEPAKPNPDTSQPEATPKLEIPEYVDNWNDYFVSIAWAASTKSKDSKCRVGAVIVSQDNIVLSTGFNGLARGVYDDEDILDNEENKNEKLKVICHAEHNAILNAARIGVPLQGAAIYVTKFPCLACCNAIIQAGITRIYTEDKWYWDGDPFDKEHTRKRKILRQTHLKVDAPFHPEYSRREPINPKKKKGPARETNAMPVNGKHPISQHGR